MDAQIARVPVATNAELPGPHEPLSLLDLPTELRLQIYELLPISTFVKRFRMWEGHPHGFEFSIVYKGTASPILATCRQINMEASTIMARKMDTIIETVPGILIDLEHLPKLVGADGPLLHMGSYLCLVAHSRKRGNTFSPARAPIVQPSLLASGSSDPPSFPLAIRKLILITEKRQIMFQSSSFESLELEIGLQKAAYNLDDFGIFWRHEVFAASLKHQSRYGVSFRYTLRPVAKEFEEEDIDTYYRARQLHEVAMLGTSGRKTEDLPVHVAPGEVITDEEFEVHWSI